MVCSAFAGASRCQLGDRMVNEELLQPVRPQPVDNEVRRKPLDGRRFFAVSRTNIFYAGLKQVGYLAAKFADHVQDSVKYFCRVGA